MLTALDKNTALVIIDLQKGIAGRQLAHSSADIIANSAKLAEAFRKEELPVFVVNVDPFGSPSSNTRVQDSFMPKDEAARAQAQKTMDEAGFFEIVPELGAQPGDIYITKRTWNAFCDTPLHDDLQKKNITGIVITGIATSIGVEGTARAAWQRGYNVTFATDAMTDAVTSAHDNSMQHIFPRIGELDTTDAIIAHLPGREE